MTVRDILVHGPAVLAWAAVAYKLPACLRGRRDPAVRSLWLSLLFLALALTVMLPSIYVAIDRLVGVVNVARLLVNGLVLVASWAVQAFLFRVNYPDGEALPRIRRVGWGLAGTLVLLAALFVLAPAGEETTDFIGRYGSAPFVLEYRLVFLGYLGLALRNIVGLAWRYAGIAERPALRLGLRFVALGGVLGFGYVANEGLRVAAARFGLGDPLPDPHLVTNALMATSVVLMLVGCTMPAWGPRFGIPTLYSWVRQYRAYRRLHPLWLALYRAKPEIALVPPSSAVADMLSVHDLRFRLYRRVVEIRDGLLALHPYHDPVVAHYARGLCQEAGLPSEKAEVVVEAASMAVALRALAQGRIVGRPGSAPSTPGGCDLETEVAALERLAVAFRGSPIVRAVLVHAVEQDAIGPDRAQWPASTP